MTDTKTPVEVFKTTLTEQYRRLFLTPEYAYSASRCTPEALALKMTDGLLSGSANKDGDGIKLTCRALKIPYTYKGIRSFLTSTDTLQGGW